MTSPIVINTYSSVEAPGIWVTYRDGYIFLRTPEGRMLDPVYAEGRPESEIILKYFRHYYPSINTEDISKHEGSDMATKPTWDPETESRPEGLF